MLSSRKHATKVDESRKGEKEAGEGASRRRLEIRILPGGERANVQLKNRFLVLFQCADVGRFDKDWSNRHNYLAGDWSILLAVAAAPSPKATTSSLHTRIVSCCKLHFSERQLHGRAPVLCCLFLKILPANDRSSRQIEATDFRCQHLILCKQANEESK